MHTCVSCAMISKQLVARLRGTIFSLDLSVSEAKFSVAPQYQERGGSNANFKSIVRRSTRVILMIL